MLFNEHGPPAPEGPGSAYHVPHISMASIATQYPRVSTHRYREERNDNEKVITAFTGLPCDPCQRPRYPGELRLSHDLVYV